MDTRHKTSNVEKLLSALDKKQLEAFIRKECTGDDRFRDRFLALGMGTLFTPDFTVYSSRIENLIEDYSGRHGYVEYRDTFDLNRAVSQIYEEFDDAVDKHRWDVAVAILTGISEVAEDILNCGDDSAGELGGIVDECFEKWIELVGIKLPEDIRNHIFNYALGKFEKKDLKGWDWWWSWMEIATELADTPARQTMALAALDEIRKPANDDWSGNYAYNHARSYRLKVMSRCGTPEEQRKFLYENIDNPEFRRKLLRAAWSDDNIDEVLRMAKEGIDHDSQYVGLVSEWEEWELKVYLKRDNQQDILRMARKFFLSGRHRGGFGQPDDFSMEKMYSLMKEKVDKSAWPAWRTALIKDASKSQYQLLYIFTQEKLWDDYLSYIKSNPTRYLLEDAPAEVRNISKKEFIYLYARCVESHFNRASDRNSYRDGASMLKNLIEYGGREEAKSIIEQQKGRKPRRPALIDELSKIKMTSE